MSFIALGRVSALTFVASGSGAGFQLFTQGDNNPGIYADAAARNNHFTANPDDLARLDADPYLIIKLLDGGSGSAVYQQRADNAWLDVTSLVQGPPGSGTDFSHIPANHIPAIGPDDFPYDSGLSVDATGTLVAAHSIRAGINSFQLEDQFSISGAGETLSFEARARGKQYYPVLQEMDSAESDRPRVVRQGALTVLTPQSDDSQMITNPVFLFTSPVNQVVYALSVRAATEQTGVVGRIYINGQSNPFYEEHYGDFPVGETTIIVDPPVKFLQGETYQFRFLSEDGGDVQFLGDSGGTLYYQVQFRPFELEQLGFESEHERELTAVGYTAPSDSGTTVPLNVAIHASTLSGNLVLNFPAGNDTRDRIQLLQHVTGNTLTLHSDDGFSLLFDDGTQLFDNDINITNSPVLTFRWAGGDWRAYGL